MGIVAVCVLLLCARVLRPGCVVCEWNACWRAGAGNGIGAEGAQALAASLEKNTVLTLSLIHSRRCRRLLTVGTAQA